MLPGVRLAVVSDIHGSLVGLEAVVTDLRLTSPDLVVHAGDAAVMGPRPAEVVDRLRALGWPGLTGNTDEMMWEPAVRAEQERRAPKLRPWLEVLFDVMAPWAAERLGAERVAWLRSLPAERLGAGGRGLPARPREPRRPLAGADARCHRRRAGRDLRCRRRHPVRLRPRPPALRAPPSRPDRR